MVAVILFGLWQGVNAQVYYEEKEKEQEQDTVQTSDFKERTYFGGNFSFMLGNQFTYIDVSPLAGYMITSDFSIGLGATYSYLSREYILVPSGDRLKVKGSVYGGRTFLRHNIFDNYFIHTEFETLNLRTVQGENNDRIGREWVPGLFIGGGIFQPVFARGGFNLTILYNLIYESQNSPYNSPWVIRGGFTF